jgi:hypothetical protein
MERIKETVMTISKKRSVRKRDTESAATNDGFYNGSITERCLHKSRKVSKNYLVSQFFYDKRLNK